MYNHYMGGVDVSDQYLSYHNTLQKTVRYWKTLSYHLIDIGVVNSFVLYNSIAILSGCWVVTENDYRDELVLQIINAYGREQQEVPRVGRPSQSECRVRHGSVLVPSKGRCQYCSLTSKSASLTQRKCQDCLSHLFVRQEIETVIVFGTCLPLMGFVNWVFECKQRKMAAPEPEQPHYSGRGRPKGAINKNRRRGNYPSMSFWFMLLVILLFMHH